MKISELERATLKQRMRHIWLEVANGRGSHGDFLMKFADAYLMADFANEELLQGTAAVLVEKYGLGTYLDTFPDKAATK